VVYGVLTALLLYFVVYRLSGKRPAALASSALFALCSLSVTNSHFAVADAASCFWILLTCYLCYLAAQKK